MWVCVAYESLRIFGKVGWYRENALIFTWRFFNLRRYLTGVFGVTTSEHCIRKFYESVVGNEMEARMTNIFNMSQFQRIDYT